MCGLGDERRVGEVCRLVKGSLLGDECLLDGGVGDERRGGDESRAGDDRRVGKVCLLEGGVGDEKRIGNEFWVGDASRGGLGGGVRYAIKSSLFVKSNGRNRKGYFVICLCSNILRLMARSSLEQWRSLYNSLQF